LNDQDNCIYSPDVISFAKTHGFYPKGAPDIQFSFSDVYDPVTTGGARFCEGRVYSFFRNVKSGILEQYLNYILGKNLTNRMPLWIKPDRKISLNDTFTLMRDHFEGTYFEFDMDVGGEGFNLPYRWRPMIWSVDGSQYLHERATSTQQTGWSFVSQLRGNMPNQIGGIIWFGVDDSALTLHVPFYCGMQSIPYSFSDNNGDMMTFSFTSAFWVFNLVNNYVYSRYSIMHPEVYSQIVKYESNFINSIAYHDKIALTLYNQGDIDEALNYITNFSVSVGNQVVRDWLQLFQFLFTKYMDGNRKYVNPNSKIPNVEFPGYPAPQYKRIVVETGDRYKFDGEGLKNTKFSNKKIF
jgi:dipeptidase